MSTALLALVALLVAAFTFWRPLRRLRTAFGWEHLISTGHAFLVLGALVGVAIGEPPPALEQEIGPIVAFVSGWVGFATGMRFDVRVLRAVPRRAFWVALAPALAAALAVGAVSGGLLWLARVPRVEALAAALVLAAAAASSGPTLAAVVRARRAGRAAPARAALRMIEFSAGIDDLIVIVIAVAAFALLRSGPESVAPGWLLLLSLAGGAGLGAVTWLFLGGRAAEDERLLLSLAMMAFIAGFGSWLRLPPAGVAAIAAMTLVNLPGARMERLARAVRRVERPAVVILMLVIGFSSARALPWIFFPLVATLTLVRFAAKHWAGEAVEGPIPRAPGLVATERWAFGLTPQGTLGLLVALSFFEVWHDEVARAVLAATATAGILNELAGPWLMLKLLARLSHVRPVRERA
jgi:hypothetical protein